MLNTQEVYKRFWRYNEPIYYIYKTRKLEEQCYKYFKRNG